MTTNEQCNKLHEVTNSVDKISTLLTVILGDYFEHTEDAVKEDTALVADFERSYGEIQSLLYIVNDYVWAAKKEITSIIETEQ